MDPNFKKSLEIVGVILIVVLGAGFATDTSSAQGVLDWLRGLKPTTTDIRNNDQVNLYKPVAEYENAVMSAVKKASPAVVSITISKNVQTVENCPSVTPFFDVPEEFRDFFNLPQTQGRCETSTELREVGGGSGFIVASNGLILTNKHVVSDPRASYTVFTNDGKKYEAKVLARHPVQDLAIIKIEANNLPTVVLGDSSAVDLGQTAIAIGNALAEYRNTVSVGVISGLSRTITASGGGTTERLEGVLQTDAAISQGNSGGPLLNLRGEVIGINTAVSAEGQNIGFAIPINRAKKDIESVKQTGEIQTPFIGVRYLLINPEFAKQEKLPREYGALIRGTNSEPAIVSGSPAAKAGLKAEDIILELNGRKIDNDHSLADAIGEFKVGDKVTLKILRQGKEMELVLTLEKRPQS